MLYDDDDDNVCQNNYVYLFYSCTFEQSNPHRVQYHSIAIMRTKRKPDSIHFISNSNVNNICDVVNKSCRLSKSI